MTTVHKSHPKSQQLLKSYSARGQENNPDMLKGHPRVTVDIPPSPFHRLSTMVKGTRTKGDVGSLSTHAGTSISAPGSLKRKLEVFVDIPPSHHHISAYARRSAGTISDAKKSKSYAGPSLKKRRSESSGRVSFGDSLSVKSQSKNSTSSKRIPVVEIPVSQSKYDLLSRARYTGSQGAARNPLSPKVNMDFSIGPSGRLMHIAKKSSVQHPNNVSLCHQCHRNVREVG